MTKTERLEIAKVFRAAKLQLWDGVSRKKWHQEKHICFAVIASSTKKKAIDSAIDIVLSRLDSCSHLETWMRDHHPHLDTNNTVMMQHTRNAWIDSLIAEFEA
jgi:hypothetical protein